VMLSDLVSSTALSARMGAEDVCAVISAYQKCVAQVLQHFAGAQMVILAVRLDRSAS
jgi:class 3 adenylate cyclase